MIKINYSIGHLAYDIYIWRGNAQHREIKQPDGTWKVVAEGEMAIPTLQIEDLEELAKAIRDAGVKLPSDHKLEGILEAKEEHLQDMRRLVFQDSVNISGMQIDPEVSIDAKEPRDGVS